VSTVDKVRSALERGIPKKQIQQDHRISEWSLLLIEIDQPKLVDQHQLSTIERQRSIHRQTLVDYLAEHPQSSRMKIRQALLGSIDWLIRYDAIWLATTWPGRAHGYQVRTTKNNWDGLDLDLAHRVGCVARESIEAEGRPYQITKSYLLKRAGVAISRLRALPLTEAAAVQNAETRADYLQRRLSWALKEYEQLDIPLSMNKFRRLAALPPRVIEQYKSFIKAKAECLRLPIDGRCLLSNEE
jgi:hypothetical protein